MVDATTGQQAGAARPATAGWLSKRGYNLSCSPAVLQCCKPAVLVMPTVAQVLPKPEGLPVTVVRGRNGRVPAAETGQLFADDLKQFARLHWPSETDGLVCKRSDPGQGRQRRTSAESGHQLHRMAPCDYSAN